MDEKKVREAIYCMKSFADDTVCEECDNYDRCDHTMVADNARTAIEALEKQLPKKGIKEKITEGVNKGLHNFYCPVCYEKGDLSNKCNVGEYCSDCGQRLDWGDDRA